jgi:RNA polymerase sigma-70 factor (ECF subfamily)
MALDDEALVRQVLRGDQEAFGALVERYAGVVHGVVLEVVRQPEEVEDLVQEVFCRAYQELASLRRPSRFAPWLAQIARHLALTHVQREQGHSRIEQLEAWTWPVERIPEPDQVVEAQERAALVWNALDQLRPEDRQLVVLYHLEGCTLREIARFLDRSAATVRWGLLRAEKRLSHKLVGMLRSQIPCGPAGRQRLRRQVLAGQIGRAHV